MAQFLYDDPRILPGGRFEGIINDGRDYIVSLTKEGGQYWVYVEVGNDTQKTSVSDENQGWQRYNQAVKEFWNIRSGAKSDS